MDLSTGQNLKIRFRGGKHGRFQEPWQTYYGDTKSAIGNRCGTGVPPVSAGGGIVGEPSKRLGKIKKASTYK